MCPLIEVAIDDTLHFDELSNPEAWVPLHAIQLLDDLRHLRQGWWHPSTARAI